MFVCTQCNHAYAKLSVGVSQQGSDWCCPQGHRMVNTVSQPWKRWFLSIVPAGVSAVGAYVFMKMNPHLHKMSTFSGLVILLACMMIALFLVGIIVSELLRAVFCFIKAMMHRRQRGVIRTLVALDITEGLVAMLSVATNSALFIAYYVFLIIALDPY